jgi:hypothetical protein
MLDILVIDDDCLDSHIRIIGDSIRTLPVIECGHFGELNPFAGGILGAVSQPLSLPRPPAFLRYSKGGRAMLSRRETDRHDGTISRLLKILGEEREKTQAILDTFDKLTGTDICDECERLLAEYVFAMVKTTPILEDRVNAASAGLIDDISFLHSPAEMDQALAQREEGREKYLWHRTKQHAYPLRPRTPKKK